MGAGRKTKCTPETIETLTSILRDGHTIKAACEGAGIHQATYFEWLERASEGSPWAEFADAVTRAQHAARAELLSRVKAADDWRAQAWILERRFRDEFGKDADSAKRNEPLKIQLVDNGYDADKRAEE